LTTHPFQ